MKTCAECPDRPTCTELCPEMDAKASVDHVRLREIPIRLGGICMAAITWQETQTAAYTDLPTFPFLSELENKLVHDYWYSGKSYKDIAMARGYSVSAVKSRLARVYTKLRDHGDQVLRGHISHGGRGNGTES